MRFSRVVLAMCAVVGVFACTSTGTADVLGEDVPAQDAAPQAYGEPCEATVRGKGTTITIRSASCDYDYGSKATFDYEITVDATAPPIEVAPSMQCGSCRRLSTEISSWPTWTIGGTSNAGLTQTSCSHCLVGCCSPDPAGTYQLDVGTLHGKIEWTGRVTGGVGPDDGMLPEGPFFAPGRYDAEVSLSHLATVKLPFVIREKR